MGSRGLIKQHTTHTWLDATSGLEPSIRKGLATCALALASSAVGCRLLQDAIEVSKAADHDSLVESFKGHVWSLSECPHANHVLQKCIVVMPPAQVSFIIQEIQGRAV